MKFKEAVWLSLASSTTGLLLAIFSLLKAPFNAITSLLAIVITIYYFKNNDRKGLRIGFVVFAILYYVFFIFLVAVYRFNQLPPGT